MHAESVAAKPEVGPNGHDARSTADTTVASGVRMAEARASVEKMSGAITDRTLNTARATDGHVHAQPGQAIGVGAALGLAIGVMLARHK